MARSKDHPEQQGLFGPLEKAAKRPHPREPIGLAAEAETLRALAPRLPAGLHLGTSSWSFPGWAGLIYDRTAPASDLSRDGLAAYAQHPLLRSVGIDRTYYAPIGADVFARYAAAVPADFRFLVKAFEGCVTDWYAPRPGERNGRPNEAFLDPGRAIPQIIEPFVEGLGEKAGPLVFQFPPLDLRRLQGPAAFVDRLHAFLRALPPGPLYAVELRNVQALGPAYAAALRDTGVAHCFNVHSSMPSVAVQSETVDPGSGPALVVRWMLGAGLRYQEAREQYAPFDRIVRPDPVAHEEVAALIQKAAQVRLPAFVIVNNKAEGCSPLTLFRLAERLAAR